MTYGCGPHCCRKYKNRIMQHRLSEVCIWEASRLERGIILAGVYLVAVGIALMAVFFNVIYGIQFPRHTNIAWLTAVLVSQTTGTVTGSRREPATCCAAPLVTLRLVPLQMSFSCSHWQRWSLLLCGS